MYQDDGTYFNIWGIYHKMITNSIPEKLWQFLEDIYIYDLIKHTNPFNFHPVLGTAKELLGALRPISREGQGWDGLWYPGTVTSG